MHVTLRWFTHAYTTSLVTDPKRGLAYGVDLNGVFMLDSRFRRHPLLPNRQRVAACGVAFAPPDRLLVAGRRIDHPGRSLSSFKLTNFAEVVDPARRRVLHTVWFSHDVMMCALGAPAVLAVDASTHHGFLADSVGHGITLDMESGRVLRSMHTPTHAPLPWTVSFTAIDARTHHLFIAGSPVRPSKGVQMAGPGEGLALFDSRTGNSLRLVPGVAGIQGLAVDPGTEHVIAVQELFGSIDVVDASTGRLVHSTIPKDFVTGQSPVAVDSITHHAFLAYLTHPDTLKPHVNFLMVDTRNGKILLRRDLGMGLENVDIVEDPGTRALYFCAFRYVWLFDAATGRLVQRVNVSTPKDIPGNRLALDAPHHHLLVWGHDGIEVLTYH